MSQSHQRASLPGCPSCEEPLESGDRFCGACGYDLSAVPALPVERPTVAIRLPAQDAGALGPAAGAQAPPPDVGPSAARGQGTLTRDPAAPTPSACPPGAGTPPGATSGAASVEWPAASEVDSSDQPAPTHRPDDLPGTDSGGRPLPAEAPSALRLAGPDPGGFGDFELAAPDPRTAEHAAAAVPACGPVCVACRCGRVDTDGYCENCGHAQPRERDHMEQELGAVAVVSDRGLRHHRNEDAFAVSGTALPDGSPAVVAIVCDGVSSSSRPDEAAAAAAAAANEALLESLPRGAHPQQAMHEAILAASEAVNALAQGQGRAMEHEPHRHQNAPACTLVGAISAGGLLVVGWVGDSRVYWVPQDRAEPPARLTEDDSWAAQMVATGLMNEAEAYADERAHAITGWLGADAYELEPHTASFKPDRPGVVVVCTDGLWNYAEGAADMAAVMPPDSYERPLHGAQVMVGHALDGGGHDNVTVALLPFAVPPKRAGSACPAV
ncbi:protein phosphatase 2C domain-containing protein [Streptomyces sp. NBC_01754]|uniref:protein phosphatase 2C domain-containing protein n=1 Tax=Streptomyces sp. NBC_01754 TaxID=2975930 RepID=UPI002DD8305E|nr:protein phosphatase 2C domain-containing protein [Streptomyces sp. NBC_01754]WSC96791.1 protein phosphatase 2C domain-containing protein [Streptomyces sp. NBC_01754]